MGIVYVLLPASLLLALVGVIAFVWAARSRQFDGVEVSAAKLLLQRDQPVDADPGAAAVGESQDERRNIPLR